MNRPLFVIFVTLFVNLVGFGIIIPLLPFYASTFGASPVVIGLLFASFSICQLIAAPVLGELSDRWGRRPVLLASLVGTAVSFGMLAFAHSLTMLFAARIVDGLSGGNISIARAYIADVTEPEDRARAFGLMGAAFGLGFILGPAIAALLAPVSYRAPILAATAVTMLATALAWQWLPETRHRARAALDPPWRTLPGLFRRRNLRLLLMVDFLYWGAFAVYQTTFALFGARRFGMDAMHIGYLLSVFGLLGATVQGLLVGRVARRLGPKLTYLVGIVCAGMGFAGGALSHSPGLFLLTMVAAAVGVGLCNPSLLTLVSLSAGSHEQGRVQGGASALESLGRTIGPVWGNGALGSYGEGTAFGSAALVLFTTAVLMSRYRPLALGADPPPDNA